MILIYFSVNIGQIIGSLKGRTAGYDSRKTPAVRVSWVTCGTLAVSGHGVGDALWTSVNVLHLIGPVAVTGVWHSPLIMADIDWILSATPRGDGL